LGLSGCRRATIPPESIPTPIPGPTPRKIRIAPPKPRPARKAQVVYAIRTSQKVFALTFDDGPHPTYTPQILAILKKHDVKATFFMVGSMVRAYPKIAQTVARAGHATANHSWSHPFAPKAPKTEVERTEALMNRVMGNRNPLFRPPYGLLHNGMADVALKNGTDVIIWSSFGADWDKDATAKTIAAKVLHRASPGGIALLHDGGGHRNATVAALPTIISRLKKRGYRFVTVPQLLKMGPPSAKPDYLHLKG
jgi:chitin deacetylase